MPLSPILFLGKSYVGTHVRRLKNGKVITVGPYYDKRIKKGTEHVREPLGRDFEDVQGLSPESMDLLERMHKEQHLLHHYHGHALRKRIAEHAEAIKSLTETAKAHRAAGKEVEATQAVNRALKRKSDLLRHQKELAEVDAKVAGIGAMMAKISPGAGDVYDSTEDSHKQYVDKMGSRWKASPRSPAKVTIPPAVEQSLMRLLGGFRSYAEGLERARATDQQFNGDGRYANEYAQNNKDRLEASEAFLAAKLGSIVNAANRAAAEEFIAKHRPDTNLTAHEQGFFGAKPADKKDEAIQAAVDHLKEDATQQDIPAKEKREDAALVAKLEGAKDAEPKATGGESGPFGPIFRQFHHDAQGAIEHLKQAQTGEAVAALYHPEVGDIDLVWGRTSDDPRSTGEGLAKLLRWHPEVLGDLQGFISSLHVHQKHKTRIHLTNDLARRAAVRLDYSGKTKTWLLTAYEVNSGGDRSGVGSASGGISAAAGRKDETILAPSPSASDDSSIAQAVGSGKDSAPQEGEVNAEGLVFRGGRWHQQIEGSPGVTPSEPVTVKLAEAAIHGFSIPASPTPAKALAMLKSEQSRVLFFKSYVPAHTRRTKAGAVVQVAAYYDKRSRKGVELAGGHHHDLSHLDDTQRTKFEQMHKEQHLLHHYQAHALKKKIAEHEAEQAKAEKEAQEHREAGRHVDATKAANRALRAKSSLSRHRRELEEVNAKVAGIGAMKDRLVSGSGSVSDSTDESYGVYAEKLGHRWKKTEKPSIVEAQVKPEIHREDDKSMTFDEAETGGFDLSAAAFKDIERFKITKVGRKFVYGIRPGKTYEQKIVRNSVSRPWKVGDFVETPTYTASETSRFGYSSTVIPATQSMVDHREKAGQVLEVQRWLGYVEDKAKNGGYLYQKGIDKLRELRIEYYPEEKSRLEAAIASVTKKKEEAKKVEESLADQAPKVESGQYGKFYVSRVVGGYRVTFNYDYFDVLKIKGIRGAQFNRDDKSWYVPLSSGSGLKKIMDAEAKDTKPAKNA